MFSRGGASIFFLILWVHGFFPDIFSNNGDLCDETTILDLMRQWFQSPFLIRGLDFEVRQELYQSWQHQFVLVVTNFF